MRIIGLALLLACQFVAWSEDAEPRGWFILRWVEKPVANGPATTVEPGDVTRFDRVLAYDEKQDAARFREIRAELREGDLIAYYMDKWDARKEIARGRLNTIGYRLLKYGHLGIVVADADDPKKLRLFSSQSFKGPNTEEDIDTLEHHSWHVYRLDKWERVSRPRLHAFVKQAHAAAGRWTGYDFSGMFGLWNSNLKPESAQKIGHDYICSTVVVAALHYAGLDLDAVHRKGLGDLVSPQQVVSSPGRIIPLPQAALQVESSR